MMEEDDRSMITWNITDDMLQRQLVEHLAEHRDLDTDLRSDIILIDRDRI
jgi:hypothetical protein